MNINSCYTSPLSQRYAGKEMQYLFSPQKKFTTWRRLWVALAEAEAELGLNITDVQLDEMRENIENIDFEEAKRQEKIFRHDVMAHVHTYGKCCPSAKGIIHLGATSCYVGDNTDLIIMREALELVLSKLVHTMENLKRLSLQYKDLPMLAYTHFQPAQPTTLGKRCCLWLHDLLLDFEQLSYIINSMKLLGSKGTTGSQASFLELFEGDHEKCKELDKLIAKKMGFNEVYPVSGQTYSRKIDYQILSLLSSIAQSAHKFSNDMRLLQHLKEVEEPFEANQIGSSAMAYKRNPMRCERMAALANYVIADSINPAITHATQWFERTLDDSANKRISVSEAFLAIDGILNLYINVTQELVVYPKVIEAHLMAELPFMATENILMKAVKKGGDRQLLHERIRLHSMEAARIVKEEGKPNDLLERIACDKAFMLPADELEMLLDPNLYTGRSKWQVEEFIEEHINPVLKEHAQFIEHEISIEV